MALGRRKKKGGAAYPRLFSSVVAEGGEEEGEMGKWRGGHRRGGREGGRKGRKRLILLDHTFLSSSTEEKKKRGERCGENAREREKETRSLSR